MDSSSQRMWMTLDELSRSPDFEARIADEFPQGASSWPDGLSRRRFLQLMGASLALAGLNGCVRLPEEKIVPYTQQPEKLIPGNALHYATTLRVNGQPRGVIVTQHEGRPTHIAGNPLHPMSLGASDIWTTASILDLYDPDRLQAVRHEGNVTSWSDFEQSLNLLRGQLTAVGGAGLAFVTAPLTSPTELRLMRQFLAAFPQAKWYTHDPLAPSQSFSPENFDLSRYRAILALECDFLFGSPRALSNVRAFSQRRQSDQGSDWNRLYVAESCPTVTGTKADHRFAVAPQDFDEFSQALLDQLQDGSRKNEKWPWIVAVADDLRHDGLIMAGPTLSDATQERIRQARLSIGAAPNNPSNNLSGGFSSPFIELIARLKSGEISTLILSQVNPVYDSPVDFDFGDLLSKVPLTLSHVLQENETSEKCRWSLPAAHDLEAWGDAQAIDDTYSIIQPLIAPLYESRSLAELLALLSTGVEASGYELVRETWHPVTAPSASPATLASAPSTVQVQPTVADSFDANWRRWLREGIVKDAGPANLPAPPEPSLSSALNPPPNLASGTLALSFRPSPGMWDGRHANNGWLQELSDPITKLTWDNAAMVSPATAARWKLKDGDLVSLTAGDQSVDAPVIVVPGHADLCITLPLGYGRSVCGSVGRHVGFNAYRLRRSGAPWFCQLDKLEPTGRTYPLAGTQEHFRMEQRDLLHVSRTDEAPAKPEKRSPASSAGSHPLSGISLQGAQVGAHH